MIIVLTYILKIMSLLRDYIYYQNGIFLSKIPKFRDFIRVFCDKNICHIAVKKRQVGRQMRKNGLKMLFLGKNKDI